MLSIENNDFSNNVEGNSDFIAKVQLAIEANSNYIDQPNVKKFKYKNINITHLNYISEPVRAFKVRGAFNAVREVNLKNPNSKIIVASSGSFGISVAFAASIFKMDCTVYSPRFLKESKKNKILKYNSKINASFDTYEEAKKSAKNDAKKDNVTFIDGISDPVLVGNGSIFYDIMKTKISTNSCIIMPLGIGSLAYPVALLNNLLNLYADIITVEPQLWAKFYSKLNNEYKPSFQHTIAEGAAVMKIPTEVEGKLSKLIKRTYAPEESEISNSMSFLLNKKIYAEGAGALSFAPILYNTIDFEHYDTCIIIGTGYNI